jgi:hypothetical protein
MNSQLGGRQMGLGYASSCLHDEWAIFNNTAGLSKIKQTTTAFAYDAMPSLKSFNRMGALIAMPTKVMTTALGIFRFGDDLYNEQFLSAGFANKLGLASLGLRVNYIQYHAEGFGNYQAFTISFGGIAELTNIIHVGAHITNLNHPIINKQTGEKMPTLMSLAIAINPSDKTILTSEVQKDLNFNIIWKTGLEYKFYKKFAARTGFNLNPQAAFLGFGWKSKRLTLDYALKYNPLLGNNHQASVSFQFSHQ